MISQGRSSQTTARHGVSSRLVASPSIDLPKGGGALKGIDEKFAANPVTGSASFSIPLPLSPSRGGIVPEIDLSYDSGSGNGPFGLGWSLSVPHITRKTDKGLPRYRDKFGDFKDGNDLSDVFVMSGAEDLVPKDKTPDDIIPEPNGYTVRLYRPRVESGFARIEQWTNNATGIIHWRTISADNTTRIYGESENARVADPTNEKRIFQWLLEFSHDGKGSAVTYTYKSENSDGVQKTVSEKNRLNENACWTNRYLKSVSYGNFAHCTGGAYPADSDYHFELVFDYGEHDLPNFPHSENKTWAARPDPFSQYRAGFEIRSWRRCERVLMFHKFPEFGTVPCLVRSVDFDYGHNDSGISQLIKAQQKGYKQKDSGEYESKALPAMTFTYQAHEWNSRVHELDTESLSGLPAGLAPEGSHFLDLYGEGLSGVLTEQGQGWYYKRNLGGGKFGPVTALKTRPHTGSAVGIQELEGDSEKYLVDYAGDVPGFYRFQNGEMWTGHQPFKKLPNINFNSPHVKVLDLDGDGRADLLVDDDRVFTYYRSEGKDGFALESQRTKVFDEEKGPRIIFADYEQTIFLADMSGDGLTDIVRVRNGNVCYWPNLGHGRFGAKVCMSASPMMDRREMFSTSRVRLADVDGSGASDLIYISADKVTVWLNKSGNGFTTEGREFRLRNDNTTQISVLDFLGQGTACIVWSSPLPSYSGRRSMRYIDLMGGKKPHLMVGYDNGFGKSLNLEYTPSTKYYLDDRKARKPWVTKLPFPVHCLSKVISYDKVSDHRFSSVYKYHHGYYDIAEREFRGFGCVEQIDSEDFKDSKDTSNGVERELYQDPVLTKTWFHLGAWIQNKGILEHYESEYHPVYKVESKLEQPKLGEGWKIQEVREAMRAFKGMMLRQEVYALDGSELEDKPYTTTQTSYAIQRLQAKGEKRHAVYHVTESESLTHHYERDLSDPRIAHSLVLESDNYGRPELSAKVVYGRKPEMAETGAIGDEQKKRHIVITETEYANDVRDINAFRMGVECSVKTWELTGTISEGIFKIDNLLQSFSAAAEISFETEPTSGLQKRFVEHIETVFYDENLSTTPLSAREMASHGLPYESYTLSYTPSLLSYLYDDDNNNCRVDGNMLTEGGFLLRDGNWWARTGRNIYDTANTDFFLPRGVLSAFGAETTIDYDGYNLLIVSVTDELGNKVTAENDYRTLNPVMFTDPNNNRTMVATDALGIVVKTAIMGKVNVNEGDTLDDPTTEMKYDFAEFDSHGQLLKPSWVSTLSREVHGSSNTRWLEQIEYSDGSGRIALAKTKAAPDKDGNERWVGTGRTVLNNKSNPVKQYEPYFSDNDGWESEPEIVETGVTPIMYYDPLSRLIRTDFPDGAHSKVEFTAWRQDDYDQNDTTAGNSHYNTPTITHLDSLGRPFYVVANDGVNDNIVTRTVLDIEGNEKEIIDARNNPVMKYKYGIHGEKAYTKSMDAGERWLLLAADEQPIYTWDSREHKLHTEYDVLRRPTKQWLNDEMLVGETVYGESDNTHETNNLRGQIWKVYDQSGLVENVKYDFKGNLLESKRRLTQEYKQTIGWSASPAPELEDETFTTITAYDALNRALNIKVPHNNVDTINEILPEYDEGGLLKCVKAKLRGSAQSTDFVTDINYNPKGQRTRIKYGNGVTTKYMYDDKTFRLTRLWTFRSNGTENLQDLNYTYDPVGNITEITDNAQQTIFFNGQVINPSQTFEYDALYRLTKATGREHIDNGAGTELEENGYLNAHTQIPADATALRNYIRKWEYDEVGNILKLIHNADNGDWSRTCNYASDNNRLMSTKVGQQAAVSYMYNVHGSMTAMPHLQAMEWDFAERLSHVTNGTTEAYYNYDGSGERVRKVVEKNNGSIIETRLYLGGFEVFRKKIGNTLELERETLHIMDDGKPVVVEKKERESRSKNKHDTKHKKPSAKSGSKRMVMIETKTWENGIQADNPTLLQRYQLGNNIESATLELDKDANIISYEEYYPYGDTSYQAGKSISEVSQKRYRYTGKEKDEENGLYYHGARYYACWLGRWTAVDPAELVDGVNLYVYCSGNPVKYIDTTGMWVESAWDIFSLTVGVHSFVGNVKEGNVGSAIVDGVGIVIDAAAVALPIVPGGVGVAIKGARAVDAAKTTKKVADTKKKSTITENAAKGKAHEKQVGDVLGNNKASQVTIEAPDGTTRIRADYVQNKDGKITLTEAKSSENASLTKNQERAFPQIETSGGTVKGNKGNEIGLPAETKIPPTKVEVIRPSDLEKLKIGN